MIENMCAVISSAFCIYIKTYSWAFHVYFMCVMMFTYCWIYISLYVGTKWYVPVLTHPCSSMSCTFSGMSLVHVLEKVQNLLERGVEFLSHVEVVTGGVVLCPIVAQVSITRPPKKSELLLIYCPVA